MGALRWSYVSGPSEKPLLGMTIGDMFDQTVAKYPDNEALVVCQQGLRYTYTQLKVEVDRCARALMAHGIAKGDRIGIWAPNRAEWAITQFATSKIGAILVNINPAYRLHEVEYALHHSGCSLLIMSPQFKSSNYAQMMAELVPELIQGDRSPRLPRLRGLILLGDTPAPGMMTWETMLAEAEKVDHEDLVQRQAEQQFDDPINIQYTSGTTGYPKGATLSHHNIINNGYFVAELMNFTHQDRLIIPVPLYHCFGMVMGNLGCITHGATMIYPSEGFDALAVLQAVEAERATALYGVPTMFIAELEHPEFANFDLKSLRTGVMAGSPCPIEVMKRVQSQMHMRDVEICYGMTETSPVSTQTRMGTPLDKQVGTVGQVHPHVEVKIINPLTGRMVPVGETGELCTRGYSVMLGYWDNESATRGAIDPGRWMHTGDLATMDDEGYVNIVGRIKDMIIRGGENVYPREIEEFLYSHPKVSDVQVIGVPDIKYGEEIMAWIKLKPGESADDEEIRTFCRGQIAHYKIPRYIKFVDAFPMTVTGKIQKFLMRQQSIQDLGLDAAAHVETA
ncbi:acyl-CoA synthase [Oscillochloris trichoides DG-6]|uniref:Acyl-CoA synthase n=1 Tax=Oscillochloris trichoides DG-6 TaxID=765420 RepID=E1IFB2_9CHLR|nr:AMP-binding protein [Oscillochloris trichoides]EFO80117.1 acyl-CoA synthase [Oscillochloris trichoides DG-6]